MKFLSVYQDQLTKSLTEVELQTLKILVWLIQVHKQVRIERLAACLPLPIKYESRRKHIQRFLLLPKFSISLFWFPLIKLIINQEFSKSSRLILALDRTQWKDKNVFMVSVIWKKRAMPVYWQVLKKRGSSNFREQKALIRPVLKLLKEYELIIIGDREFHGVELAYWLKNRPYRQGKKVYFAFRQKQDTYFKTRITTYQKLRFLANNPGIKLFFSGINITKRKGFGKCNLAAYWKQKYKGKEEKEPWFITTNLDSLEEVLQVYSARSGIEAMFKDCKTGGYNLEGSKAKTERLTTLILFIAIAYTACALKGKHIKNQGQQKYIARLKELGRVERRHSDFWVGLYGLMWLLALEFCTDWVEFIVKHNRNKLPFYQQGFKAMSLIAD